MKLIISLLAILGIIYTVAWFGYDMHPRDLTYRVINEITSFGSSTKEAATDVANTGSRFSEVIQNRYNSQDMTEPHRTNIKIS